MSDLQELSASTCPGAGWRAGSIGLVLGLIVACAGGPPLAVKPGPFETLAEDEGFLVVQVDSDLAIERIDAGRRPIVRDLQPGRHLWLVRMKAGRVSWTEVKLAAQAGNARAIPTESKGVLNEREFDFDVEAGAINYPGEIVVRMDVPERGIGAGVTIRNRNHSAMAIRRLSKSHPELVEAHPLRYAGASGDEFLQFYTRQRSALRGEASDERVEAGGPR